MSLIGFIPSINKFLHLSKDKDHDLHKQLGNETAGFT